MSELFAKGVLHGLIGPGAIILNDYVLTVSDIDGGHRLTIARGNDVQTLDVLDGLQGDPGAPGVSPTVTVTEIEGGHRVTVTDAAGAKSFDVLNGAPGEPGQPGQPGAPGVSPTVEVVEIDGGHRVTIADANGSQSFDVLDGVGGAAEIDMATDEEVLAMLAELGALPVAADSDGAVIVDANGTIVM